MLVAGQRPMMCFRLSSRTSSPEISTTGMSLAQLTQVGTAGATKRRPRQRPSICCVGVARHTADMKQYTVSGSWEGWQGETLVEMTDGSIWKQAEYHYEYRYAYRPRAEVNGDKMLVDGMRRAVRVRRVHEAAFAAVFFSPDRPARRKVAA